MLKMQEIKEIIRLIDQSSISEFVYETNGSAVTIKKASATVQGVTEQKVTEVQTTSTPEQKQSSVETEDKAEETTEAVADDSVTEILSPMVGTYYSKPSPESDSYVNIGSQVNATSIVCIVEAMKLFNEIESEISGEIVEVLVGDGELVEFGQPLFKVKTK